MPQKRAMEDASFDGLQSDKLGEAETYLDITAEASDEAICAAFDGVEVVHAHAYFGIGFFVNVVDILPAEEIPRRTHKSKN